MNIEAPKTVEAPEFIPYPAMLLKVAEMVKDHPLLAAHSRAWCLKVIEKGGTEESYVTLYFRNQYDRDEFQATVEITTRFRFKEFPAEDGGVDALAELQISYNYSHYGSSSDRYAIGALTKVNLAAQAVMMQLQDNLPKWVLIDHQTPADIAERKAKQEKAEQFRVVMGDLTGQKGKLASLKVGASKRINNLSFPTPGTYEGIPVGTKTFVAEVGEDDIFVTRIA